MRFEIVKDKERARQLIEKHQKEWKKVHEKHGNLVCWSMLPLPEPFPRLNATIYGSKHREGYYHVYYFIETKEKYLSQIIPAAEYYKFTFKVIAEKLYSLEIVINQINAIIKLIKALHQRTRRELPATAQPFFQIGAEVYALKSEVAGFLFFARSIMDTLATLIHFLYGPKSRQFNSFVDFAKYIIQNKSENKKMVDKELKDYIESNLEWFWKLRDIRDYITHTSSADITFYEDENRELKIYLEQKYEIKDILNDIVEGLRKFMLFFDSHFVNLLNKDSN